MVDPQYKAEQTAIMQQMQNVKYICTKKNEERR